MVNVLHSPFGRMEGGGGWSWKFWEFEVAFSCHGALKKGRVRKSSLYLQSMAMISKPLLSIPVYSAKLLISSMKQ